MKRYGVTWLIAGCAVLIAATVVSVRRAQAPVSSAPRRLPLAFLSQEQADVLVEAMLACLENDARARRVTTRRFVEAVADLAERGEYTSAETHFALGLRLYNSRSTKADLVKAEAAYRNAIELRPDWAMAHNDLGIVLHSLGQRDEAEAEFREAIRLDPTRSRPHNDLAILYRVAGRLDLAEKEALRALELAPDSVAAHNNYGNLLLRLGRFDEARQEYERAIAIEPGQPAPYYNLACLASKEGDAERAYAFLSCAIVLDGVYREEAKSEEDFAPLRDRPEFRRIVHGDP